MKLYKPVEASEIFRTGITHKPATLSDIRLAAKEMGYVLAPIDPNEKIVGEMAMQLWPDDLEAGKALQRIKGCCVVFPKVEVEMAAGKYLRLVKLLENDE